MSQINCIENILGFFKKKMKRKQHKQEERQHTKIYFWVLQNIELKITLKMKFAMNLKLLNSQRLGLPKALLVSSVLFCLYLNILYSCLCSCVVRTVIYISVHSKMDLRLSQAVWVVLNWEVSWSCGDKWRLIFNVVFVYLYFAVMYFALKLICNVMGFVTLW